MNKQHAERLAGEVIALATVTKAPQNEIDAKIENSIKYLTGIEKGLVDFFMARLLMDESLAKDRLDIIKSVISKSEKVLAG